MRVAPPLKTSRPVRLPQAVGFTGTAGRVRLPVRCKAQSEVADSATVETDGAKPAVATPPTILNYKQPTPAVEFGTGFKLAFALPWRRFKDKSVLTIKLSGDIAELSQPRFSKVASMPDICGALRKAAYDPRIVGVCFNIDGLGAGYAKLQEIRKHIEFFRKSGKFSIAYMKRGGEKEYFLATACEEIYIPPSAQLSLRGISVAGTFLKGTLEKVGIEPQIKRIGKFKSAGDQLMRTDMAEPQREQLTALLDDIYGTFVDSVAESRGKTREEVIAMLDQGIYDMEEFKRGGWVTDLKYSDEVNEDLKSRTGGPADKVASVSLSRYRNVRPATFGLSGRKRIAIVRAQGAIVPGSGGTGGQITADSVIEQLRGLAKNKGVAGIVLRVDSPGGDALASDLMWREIQQLNKTKPVIASMGDVAASGGFYMAMAAPTIVAHPLTITGSIGVVTGKFNLEKAFEKVGYAKETISRGQFAELLTDQRGFNEAEAKLFDEAAEFAYRSFRDKAASSRGMEAEEMEQYAQGRVWSGMRAVDRKLVDHLGGIDVAIALCKQACKIPQDEEVTLLEVSKAEVSPLALLGGDVSAVDTKALALMVLTDPAFLWGTFGLTMLPAILQPAFGWAANAAASLDGSPKLMLPEPFQQLASGGIDSLEANLNAMFPQAVMPAVQVHSSNDASASLVDIVGELLKNVRLHQ